MQEVLPSLMQVLHRPLRPVTLHLFSPQEKDTLAALVSTLVAYAVTFDVTQTAHPLMPGSSAHQLTPLVPAIHTLCAFPVWHCNADQPCADASACTPSPCFYVCCDPTSHLLCVCLVHNDSTL